MPGLRSALACTAVALCAAAPAAAAPALGGLEPCYVSARTATGFETETVAYSGSGFVPGAKVQMSVDGDPVGDPVTADPAGAIAGSFFAPGVRRGQKDFTVTAAQVDDASQVATASSTVTNLTARLQPGVAAPHDRVTFSGRGFTDTTVPIYAHYLRGDRMRTIRLAGPPAHACGRFSVRRRQFPFRPHAGDWTIRIDQSPTAHAMTPAVQIAIRVRRGVHP
jgi:hypothetical protein